MISVQSTKNSGGKAAGDTRVGHDSLCWHLDGVGRVVDLLLCVQLLEQDYPVNGNKKLVLLNKEVFSGSQLMGPV